MGITWFGLCVVIVVGVLITLAIIKLNSFESFIETPIFKWGFKGIGKNKSKDDSIDNYLGD